MWGLIIALIILGIAYFIKYFAEEVIEHETIFVWIVIAFFVLYAGAALAVGKLDPLSPLIEHVQTAENTTP